MRTATWLWFSFLLIGNFAVAKSINWSEIKVDAYLTERGHLEITETLGFVFDGDYNGGERKFDLRRYQEVRLKTLERYEGSSARWVSLAQGEIDKIDRYRFYGRSLLRWRARLASDLPFQKTRITYRLNYLLTNVLRREADVYRLRHEMLFPDRKGIVKKFFGLIRLHRDWEVLGEYTQETEGRDLMAGESMPLSLDLKFKGDHPPIVHDKSPLIRKLINAFWVVVSLFLLLQLWLSEKKRNRFKLFSEFSEDVLNRYVFSLRPEVVGAVWDEKIGREEVGAMLARFVNEGKLESSLREYKILGFFKMTEMHLKLLVPHDRFSGYEKNLIVGLFPGSRKEITPRELRKYYASKNAAFYPLIEIRPGLSERVLAKTKVILKNPGLSIFELFYGWGAIAFFLSLWGVAQHGASGFGWLLGLSFSSVLSLLIARQVLSVLIGKSVVSMRYYLITTGLVLLIPWLINTITFTIKDVAPLIALATMFWSLCVWSLVLNCIRSRSNAAGMHWRAALSLARQYFILQFKQEKPKLEDHRYPYFLAYGLAKNMDRWAKNFQSGTTKTADGRYWSGGKEFSAGGDLSGKWSRVASGYAALNISSRASGSGSRSTSSGGFSGGGGGGGW